MDKIAIGLECPSIEGYDTNHRKQELKSLDSQLYTTKYHFDPQYVRLKSRIYQVNEKQIDKKT